MNSSSSVLTLSSFFVENHDCLINFFKDYELHQISNRFFAYNTDPCFCESPTQMYSIRKKMRHTEVEVSIVSVDNIGERCQKESIKRGFGGFPYTVRACTFWEEENDCD